MASSQQLRQEQLPHSHQQQQQQHKRQRHSIRFRSHSPPPPHKRRAIKEDYEAAEEEDVKKGRSIINNSINNNLNLRMPAVVVADEKMVASVAAAATAKLRNGQHQQLQQQQNGHHPPKRNRQLRHQFSQQQLSLAAEKLAVPLAPAEVMATDGDGSSNGCGPHNQVYKLVLTGGPCGGKTTGQERLATFFEGLGWKVFTVPEAATILLNGRIRFQELNEEQAYLFQKDLLLTLLQVEQVFVNQANAIKDRNVLVICDRGALDPSAYMDQAAWDRLLGDIKKDVFDLRDNRYNQIVHMVTAADGAPKYYTCANNLVRSESMDEALSQDRRTREAWIGHQCLSIVDNSDCRNFNDKIMKLIKVVSERLGISYEDRLAKNSKKRKWLVTWVDEQAFRDNKFEEFSVTHSYLITTDNNNQQVRLRARFQNGRTTYTLTTRRYEASDGIKLPEPVETRKQLTRREYSQYLSMRDRTRIPVHKKRRCFVYGNVYFHLDTYVEPLPPACNGHPLMILETYTTRPVGDPEPQLPTFLTVDREITGEPAYSMYNLACRGSASSQNGTGIVMLQNDQ